MDVGWAGREDWQAGGPGRVLGQRRGVLLGCRPLLLRPGEPQRLHRLPGSPQFSPLDLSHYLLTLSFEGRVSAPLFRLAANGPDRERVSSPTPAADSPTRT